MLEHLAPLSRERLVALVTGLQQQVTMPQRQVAEVTATNEALRTAIEQLRRGSKGQATPVLNVPTKPRRSAMDGGPGLGLSATERLH
jgi:hypothetical protein